MYRPSAKSKSIFEELQQNKTWEKVNRIFQKYKEKWKGPDIPIYIFPYENKSSLLLSNHAKKSGVSFPDKLFLFLTKFDDDLEIEAVLVHEYHHVCRMNGLNKPIQEYTLLDSIIMEGLAEDAVHENVGEKYVADWIRPISNETFGLYWKKYLKEQLAIKKTEKLHDHLLYGKGLLPTMLGYSSGYHIVRNFRKRTDLTEKDTFIINPKLFVDKLE